MLRCRCAGLILARAASSNSMQRCGPCASPSRPRSRKKRQDGADAEARKPAALQFLLPAVPRRPALQAPPCLAAEILRRGARSAHGSRDRTSRPFSVSDRRTDLRLALARRLGDVALALQRHQRLRDGALGGAEIAREGARRVGKAVGAGEIAQRLPLGGVEAILMLARAHHAGQPLQRPGDHAAVASSSSSLMSRPGSISRDMVPQTAGIARGEFGALRRPCSAATAARCAGVM